MSSPLAVPFSGGVPAVLAHGQVEQVDFNIPVDVTWSVGSTWTTDFIVSGQEYVVGQGDVTNVVPTFALTLSNRVYAVANQTLYFSAIGDPLGWNAQDVGAGFIDISNKYAQPEDLVALASYQGRLAIFSRHTTQIWIIDADPAQFSQSQVLSNIGTFAALSVQSLGDLDVFFLSDTGIRSLRVRDSSLNAFVNDLGSPIDIPVQAALQGLTDAVKATACAIVEPTQNRYWCYIPGNNASGNDIYTLSYFPSNKIIGWSTYKTTYKNDSGNQVAFVPQKFVVFNGQVFARSAEGVLGYGGSDGNQYDNCQATIQLPFLDFKKAGNQKVAEAVDVVVTGKWDIYATPDWITHQETQVLRKVGQATFDKGYIPYQDGGTHFSMVAKSTDENFAKVSSFMLHYNLAGSPTS